MGLKSSKQLIPESNSIQDKSEIVRSGDTELSQTQNPDLIKSTNGGRGGVNNKLMKPIDVKYNEGDLRKKPKNIVYVTSSVNKGSTQFIKFSSNRRLEYQKSWEKRRFRRFGEGKRIIIRRPTMNLNTPPSSRNSKSLSSLPVQHTLVATASSSLSITDVKKLSCSSNYGKSNRTRKPLKPTTELNDVTNSKYHDINENSLLYFPIPKNISLLHDSYDIEKPSVKSTPVKGILKAIKQPSSSKLSEFPNQGKYVKFTPETIFFERNFDSAFWIRINNRKKRRNKSLVMKKPSKIIIKSNEELDLSSNTRVKLVNRRGQSILVKEADPKLQGLRCGSRNWLISPSDTQEDLVPIPTPNKIKSNTLFLSALCGIRKCLSVFRESKLVEFDSETRLEELEESSTSSAALKF